MVPVFWFLGISGSGKTTLSKRAFEYLSSDTIHFPGANKWELIDGDIVREFLGSNLGYELPERKKSVLFVGLLAYMLSKNNIGAIVANISPFNNIRDHLRNRISCYHEIYCKCTFKTCSERDPKGYYKKLLRGEMSNFIGFDIPFQVPEHPELTIDTENLSVDESFAVFLDYINYITHTTKN